MIKAIYNNFSPFKLNKFYMKSILSIQILENVFGNQMKCNVWYQLIFLLYSKATDLLLLNVSKILLS